MVGIIAQICHQRQASFCLPVSPSSASGFCPHVHKMTVVPPAIVFSLRRKGKVQIEHREHARQFCP